MPIHRRNLNKVRNAFHIEIMTERDREFKALKDEYEDKRARLISKWRLFDKKESEQSAARDKELWEEMRKRAADAEVSQALQRAISAMESQKTTENKDERKEVEPKFTFAKEENGFTFAKGEKNDKTQVID